MRKSLSCGVVLFNERGDVLLCHATETDHWDIPKGMGDPGESARETAMREMREETGIVLEASRLNDLGRFEYRTDKALHLFGVRTAAGEIDLRTCHCTSMFPSRRDGRSIPEMDDFGWIAPARVHAFASASLNRLFHHALPLQSLFDALPPP